MVYDYGAADRARSSLEFARAAARKMGARYRREGVRKASTYYLTSAKHFAHYLAYDRWFDRYEAIRSSGAARISRDEIVGTAGKVDPIYQAFPRLPLVWAIEALDIRAEDFSFVDFGSGRGRMLLAAARFPFRRVVGVEFARSLHEAAVENIRHCSIDRIAAGEVVSLHANALDYDLPEGNSVVFIFNSFQGSILEKIAERIGVAGAGSPQTIYVIYGNSDRLPAFARRRCFERIIPPLRRRLKLSLLGTVPVDLFVVRPQGVAEAGAAPERVVDGVG